MNNIYGIWIIIYNNHMKQNLKNVCALGLQFYLRIIYNVNCKVDVTHTRVTLKIMLIKKINI